MKTLVLISVAIVGLALAIPIQAQSDRVSSTSYGVVHGCLKTNIAVVPVGAGRPAADYLSVCSYTNDGTVTLKVFVAENSAVITHTNVTATAFTNVCASTNGFVSGDRVLMWDRSLDAYHWAYIDSFATATNIKFSVNSPLTNCYTGYRGLGTMAQLGPGDAMWKLRLAASIPLAIGVNTFAVSPGSLVVGPNSGRPLVLEVSGTAAEPLYTALTVTNRIDYVFGAYK